MYLIKMQIPLIQHYKVYSNLFNLFSGYWSLRFLCAYFDRRTFYFIIIYLFNNYNYFKQNMFKINKL